MAPHHDPHHNFVVIASMIMKFDTLMKLDEILTSLLSRDDVISVF